MAQFAIYLNHIELDKFRNLRHNSMKIGFRTQLVTEFGNHLIPSSANSRFQKAGHRTKQLLWTRGHWRFQFITGKNQSTLVTQPPGTGRWCIFEEVGMRCRKHPCSLCVRGTKTVNLQ